MSSTVLDSLEREWSAIAPDLSQNFEKADAARVAVDVGPTREIGVADILSFANRPLPGYLTLDESTIALVQHTLRAVCDYESTNTEKRPLVYVLSAEPGCGKSHFVRCLSKATDLPLVEANLSQLETFEHLGYWIDQARDKKAEGLLPFLFIDEADARPADLSKYLPLLWDGVFSWRGRTLKIGRTVVILVVSRADLRTFIETGRTTPDLEDTFPKLHDFLSRINAGVVTLPPLDTRLVDKFLLTHSFVRRRFPDCHGVSKGLVHVALAAPFLHSARSLNVFVQHLPEPHGGSTGVIKSTAEFDRFLEEGLRDQRTVTHPLAFHLDEHGRRAARLAWEQAKSDDVTYTY